jgi:hypothetical protein
LFKESACILDYAKKPLISVRMIFYLLLKELYTIRDAGSYVNKKLGKVVYSLLSKFN